MRVETSSNKLKLQFNFYFFEKTLRCQFKLVLLLDPFLGMRAWWKTMEPQKLGNSPLPEPEVVNTYQ